MDAALFLGGEQTDNDRLDDGYKGHIRVGHHGNGSDVIGSQHLRYQNGSGAVGRADDTDGCGVLEVKAKEYGNQDSCKNTELRGGAEQEQLGVGKQRAEIDHGADSDEKQQRHCLGSFDSHVEQPFNDTVGLADSGKSLVQNA